MPEPIDQDIVELEMRITRLKEHLSHRIDVLLERIKEIEKKLH